MIGLLGKGLNADTWSPLELTLSAKGIHYEFLSDHHQINGKLDLVISLGYDRIISEEYINRPAFGIIVFHSSDLPKGRGWAPLFYTIINKEKYLTQTMFYADKEIDSGPIIAKARYPMNRFFTISELREIDDNLTIFLFQKYCSLICKEKVKATPQNHNEATFWAKRKPKDSRIESEKSLIDTYDLMRALPDNLPAEFEIESNTVKVKISIRHQYSFESQKITFENWIHTANSLNG
jgi:methionyl-tRNA formyltransferase